MRTMLGSARPLLVKSAASYDTQVAADGPPVDYYKFNDGSGASTVADTYPVTNGTVTLTAAFFPGNPTDGTGQCYRQTIAADKANFNNGTNGRGTIELLVYTGTLPGAARSIVSSAGFFSSTGYYCWELSVTAANVFQFTLYQQGGANHGTCLSATTLTANTWYHVGLVVDKDAGTPYAKIMLNGVEDIRTTSFTPPWYQTGGSGHQYLSAGARGDASKNCWPTCRVSRLAVYTQVLADAVLLDHSQRAI